MYRAITTNLNAAILQKPPADHNCPSSHLPRSFLDRNRYDNRPTQAAVSRFRDYSLGSIPCPTMACFRDTGLAVRKKEGELDIHSTHAHQDELACAKCFPQVGQATPTIFGLIQ